MAPTKSTRNLASKALKSDSLIFTFLRSAVSSQCAGWVDMIVGFVLFEWVHLGPALSTALGAVCGGIVNCIINYRFTFRATNVDVRAVAVKYILVWAGSLTLNTLGTEGLYTLLESWHWLEKIGFKPAGNFATARVATSLLVSWFWNFPMQRYFVYRPRSFDNYVLRMFRRN